MFAHDEKGTTSTTPRPGFCEINTDAQGKPSGNYFCFVENTDTDTTTDGQIALLFEDHLGGAAVLVHQLNLPKDLLDARAGKGKLRTLSRAPQNLKTPVASGDNVADLDCTEQSVTFPH